MPRTILSPRFLTFETHGHFFEFQLTKLGHLRLVACDGRWNDRANSCRSICSEKAWTAAWEQARIEASSKAAA